jgi:DNA repair photolyase
VHEPRPTEFPNVLLYGYARGRGAALRPPNRFDHITLTVNGETLDEALRQHPNGVQVATTLVADHTRTIINRVDSPDIAFNWSINPYRGCEHGCIYCYARPTHELLGLSCGLDFETKIHVKYEAPELLRRELAHARWQGEPITMSGVTDAYQPLERTLKITRRCLKIMAEANQPVFIVTKGALVMRDVDVLAQLARVGAAGVALSVTSLDPKLAAVMEPRASAAAARLEAIRRLAEAGVPVMVMVAPVVPGITDHEVPAILEAAKEAGATAASWVMLRLPHQVKDLFLEWLLRNFPRKARKVEQLVRQMRGGKLNESEFGKRMRAEGPIAEQMHQLFNVCREKLGLAKSLPPLSSAAFRKPEMPLEVAAKKSPTTKRSGPQLGLFE